MTTAQWELLKTFGKVTLAGWALPFLFPDNTGDLMRFGDELPKASRAGPGKWIVSVQFEVLR
jgi:hypothetical protein